LPQPLRFFWCDGAQREFDEYRVEQRQVVQQLETQADEARQAASNARIDAARLQVQVNHTSGTTGASDGERFAIV